MSGSRKSGAAPPKLSIEARRAIRAALRRSRAEIDESIRNYRAGVRLTDHDRAQNLDKLIVHAKQLLAAIESLDSATLRAIVAPAKNSANRVQPLLLIRLLKLLIAQAEHARRHSVIPRRGRPRIDPFRQLVFELATVWSVENPKMKGIKSAQGERCGPMLDFIWRRLKKEKVKASSKVTLGNLLYAMRKKIRARARKARRRRVVTRKFGHVTLESLEQRAADQPSHAPPPPGAGAPAGSHAAWGEASRAAANRQDSLPAMDATRYPAHWEPGQLLNVRQFSDGTRVVSLLHEDPERAETQTLTFANSYDAQEFVSWWYSTARDDRYQQVVVTRCDDH